MSDPSARTVRALRVLADTLRSTATDLDQLATRSEALAVELGGGVTLAEAMPREPRPLIISKLTEITDRLYDAGGEVRRAEAHQLRDEGLTQEAIAEQFGVSRQRAGALLRPEPADKRGPKRPRPQA